MIGACARLWRIVSFFFFIVNDRTRETNSTPPLTPAETTASARGPSPDLYARFVSLRAHAEGKNRPEDLSTPVRVSWKTRRMVVRGVRLKETPRASRA